MTEQQKVRISKFLSLILRHKPDTIGLMLDEQGWADVPELLDKMTKHGNPVSMNELEETVATNSKQRFAFNEDHSKIRANQGHSIEVELQLPQTVPPEHLYHGTVAKFISLIKAEGLKKMSRQHVHLSATMDTAL
jgi:putative RNA 2'-phosphotransferase